MTPKQANRLRQQIAAIRRPLAAEKKKVGGYDDSRGLRYLPTRYEVQFADFAGGLTYLRWFAKNVPDNAHMPLVARSCPDLLPKTQPVGNPSARSCAQVSIRYR